jgi:hypothetical protein
MLVVVLKAVLTVLIRLTAMAIEPVLNACNIISLVSWPYADCVNELVKLALLFLVLLGAAFMTAVELNELDEFLIARAVVV